MCYNIGVMVRIDELLEKLNEEQLPPVKTTEGAVLVLAGAGSGKTRVLTTRIAYLMEEKGVPAEAILAITFTNKAANEMKERLSSIVDVSRSWVCTIHSMCVRILRMYADGERIRQNFSIYSETERNNIVKRAFKECDYDDEKLLKSVKYHIANAKTLGYDPERYAEAELLIIDDLGTEVTNQFTLSCLYDLLNGRINRRKCTFINTNLAFRDLEARYNERITSRLFGEYNPILFAGMDIRKQKIQRGK